MIHLALENKQGSGICGASLINAQYAVTAAHCLKQKNGDEVQSIVVMLGVNDMQQQFETWTTIIKVEKWYYKNYIHRKMTNDIALLKLATPVEFNEAVKPICLPPAGRYYTKGIVHALGWGAINDVHYDMSALLQEADLEVLPDSSCQNIYHKWFYPNVMMCAGYLDGSKDTCSGDSGGPIFIYDDNHDATLIGLTSFANAGCGRPGMLAVYTRIASFTNWLVSKAAPGGPICFGTFTIPE